MRFKRLKIIKMFSCTNENYRRLSSCNSWKCSTTLCMTIEFGNNDGTYPHCFIESLSLIKTCLTNTTIHYKHCCIRIDGCLDLLHFFKKSCFLFMSTWSINNDNLKFLFFEELDTFLCDINGISFFFMPKERAFYLGSIHFKLFKGSSSESICTN